MVSIGAADRRILAAAARAGERGHTLVRGALYAVVAGFVVVPSETALAWVPALCYGTGVALDKLDGIVARTVGRQTELGRRFDMAFDTFGFVVAPLVAVLWGLLPVWYLSISAARYVFRGAVWLRRVRGLPVGDLPDSDLGKYLAGVQMIFVTIAPPHWRRRISSGSSRRSFSPRRWRCSRGTTSPSAGGSDGRRRRPVTHSYPR